MKKYKYCLFAILLLVCTSVQAQKDKEWKSEEAWNAIPGFKYGDDPGPFLFVEREVENAAANPALAKEKAAKIAALLNEKTGHTGRQFLCLQLRWVGTENEVPVLAKLLSNPQDCDDARGALEMIPGEKALAALRDALNSLQGRTLLGAINSLAKRGDTKAIPKLKELALSKDKETADAAKWAIETIEKRWPVDPKRTFPVRKIPADLTFDEALAALKGDDYLMTRLAVQVLGKSLKPQAVPPLVELIRGETCRDIDYNVIDAFDLLPYDAVVSAMIRELDHPVTRSFACEILQRKRATAAFEPFLKMVASEDAAIRTLGLDGVSGIARPEYKFISPLLKIYLQSSSPKFREDIARSINVICSKSGAKVVYDTLEKDYGKMTDELLINVLPVLGKLGGATVKKTIDEAIAGTNPQLQIVALRALCNWPDDRYKDDLWKIASSDMPPEFKSMAVRAYIRVVTLKSKRPEKETLTMLQNAMKVAQQTADKNLCLRRAETIRTLDAFNWIASYLDDPALAQAACESLVELAHHRFLRQPNKARFGEVLQKVEKVTTDKKIAEEALKARMGM